MRTQKQPKDTNSQDPYFSDFFHKIVRGKKERFGDISMRCRVQKLPSNNDLRWRARWKKQELAYIC